jgi:hypothetical protein
MLLLITFSRLIGFNIFHFIDSYIHKPTSELLISLISFDESVIWRQPHDLFIVNRDTVEHLAAYMHLVRKTHCFQCTALSAWRLQGSLGDCPVSSTARN